MPAPVVPYALIAFTSRAGVSRLIAIDGVCQLTSPADRELLLGLFELLHGAIIVSESAAAVERSRSIELSNIDDVVAYAQASSSLLVRLMRSLFSGSRVVAPVQDPARVHEWERCRERKCV